MTTKLSSFAEIREQFETYIGDIVYATMITVDAKGRPRARVLIPIWEVAGDGPTGWLATYNTPVKAAHLANNPHTTFSYWSSRQNAVSIDATATWVNDPAAKRRAWKLYGKGSPPGAGYPLGSYWSDPDDPRLHLLRLEPWRVQVIRGTDLRSRIWQPDDVHRASTAPG